MSKKNMPIRKKVDAAQVMAFAARGCPNTEIATYYGISHDTLTRRFRKALDVGRANGNMAIRAVLYDEVVNQRVARLIEHVSKTRLKNIETTKLEHAGETAQTVTVKQDQTKLEKLSTDELILLDSILEKLK